MPRIILIYTKSSETEKEKRKAQFLYMFLKSPETQGPALKDKT